MDQSVTLALIMGGQAVLATALKDMVFPRGYSWDASEMYRSFESDQSEQLTLILMSVVFVRYHVFDVHRNQSSRHSWLCSSMP